MMVVLLLILLLLPYSLHSAVTSEGCLECHNNFQDFIHGGIACNDCHNDIGSIPHNEKLVKPSCTTCHQNIVRLYGGNIHEKKKITCQHCHNVHFLNKDKKNCLSCHKQIPHKSLPSKEKHMGLLECTACHGKIEESKIEIGIHIKKGISIKKEMVDLDGNNIIDSGEWDNLQTYLTKHLKGAYKIDTKYLSKGNVHTVTPKPTSCKNCHTERVLFNDAHVKFSGVSSYDIPVESRVFIPELPSITKYTQTVHGKKGVQCTDCHVSQNHIDDKICISCHEELYGIYKDTLHSKKGATKCTDCHNPHSIKSYKELDAKERLAVCSKCHKNYIDTHKWLPNTALHFKYLECSTCHSPDSTKSIVFYFGIRERGKEKVLDYADLRDISDRDMDLVSLVDRDKNGVVISKELADFFIELKNRVKKDLFIGSSIIVTKVYHEYSVKRQREKVCATCHSEHAAFYDSMFLILPEKDKYIYIPVKGTTLSALPTSLVIDMFLLGEEKVKIEDFKKLFTAGHKERLEHIRELGLKWIDLLGILLTLLTFLLIIIHAMVRIAKRR